jgi:hypothetical protein
MLGAGNARKIGFKDGKVKPKTWLLFAVGG